MVQRLLSSGADPNTTSSNPSKDPALMVACSLPSPDTRQLLLDLLLDKGARVDSENSVGQTALMRAAGNGDAGTCSVLLEAGASVGKEVSPSHKLMLDSNCIVAQISYLSHTHTHTHANSTTGFCDDLYMCECIEYKSDRVHTSGHKLYTTRKLVLSTKCVIDSYSPQDCNGNTALSHAAESGHEGTVRLMVLATKQQGTDIDHRNMRGLTPLLISCQRGHLSAARVLVQEGGASPSIRDLDNFTTAAEWMQRSGLYLESDLKFLFPVSRKKSYHRWQRQERGIKTLGDYLSTNSATPATDVFSFRESTKFERSSAGQLSPSPSPNQAQSPSRSMFDVTALTAPPSLSPFRKKSVLPRLPNKPNLSQSIPDFRADLYRSRHLKQRQMYVAPNRQSGGYHSGALQPIACKSLERVSQNQGQESAGRDGGQQTHFRRGNKHTSLPPIE